MASPASFLNDRCSDPLSSSVPVSSLENGVDDILLIFSLGLKQGCALLPLMSQDQINFYKLYNHIS